MNPEIPTDCLPAELVKSTGFLLARLGVTLKMETMEAFEQAGFSPYQYAILALLDEGARTTQAAIAKTLAYDPSQLVAHLDALEEHGLIERRRDPNDRRRQMVNMTPAGRRKLAAFRKLVHKIEDEFLEALDEHDRAALHDLLLTVAMHRDSRFQLPLKSAG
jgi:MarR family transcriptional regulator, lower aerobic nicotinate degradation pathway regulator